MSTGGYKIRDKESIHFVTFAVTEWVDVFTRREYRDIVLDSTPPPRPHHPGAEVLVKRKAVRRWNEAWVCVLASSAGLVTTARTNMR